MARCKKYLTVNGVEFELKQRNLTKCKEVEYYIDSIVSSSRMLDDCYERPSQRKQAIFDSWWSWYKECDNVFGFGIRSYNTNIFTLQGYICLDSAWNIGIIDITPTHNYIWVDNLNMF